MQNYLTKPYDGGYEAPRLESTDHRRAILCMIQEEGDTPAEGLPEAPAQITLRLEMRLTHQTAGHTLERIHNGQSGGVTALYEPGNVLLDGSDNLKPLSKVQAVEFVYQSHGWFVDEEDKQCLFYGGHPVARMIQLTPGQVVFQKPFAGCGQSLKMETTFKKADRDEWTEVKGYGRDTYPLYPYGGYVPPTGDLRDMEQVYALVGMDRPGAAPVTALKLYRSSFFHRSGGFPPAPFGYDHKKWVFPQAVSDWEQMTVAQALAEGRLTFSLKDGWGDVYSYQSWGYDQPGGSLTHVHVHCVRGD